MYDHKDGIRFRKVEESDLPALLALKQESWWGTHKCLVVNSADQQKWFHSIPNDQLYMIGEHKGTPVGVGVYTDIDWVSRTLKISGSLYKEHRRWARAAFACGTDFAFEMLNMHRVEAEVLDYHVAAQKIEIECLGMKVEGRKREAAYKCGRYYDSIILGLLRSEWQCCERVAAYGGSCNNNFDPDKMDKLKNRFSPGLGTA